MAIRPFLAMTVAEIRNISPLPDRIGWMACHFSPYSTGLTNRPKKLRSGSLLIVNDVIPIHGHDPEIIAAQLLETIEEFDCCSVLLDFQRPDNLETERMASFLTDALPCPVAVSDLYANSLSCPVFLSPLPPHLPLREHCVPWQDREIWLELALDGEMITLTESGAHITPLPPGKSFGGGHEEKNLHCHYRIETRDDRAVFTLWRTAEDIQALLDKGESVGITTAVGLYQEFRRMQKPPVGIDRRS